MANKGQRRRQQKLARQKKKRGNKSRPGRDRSSGSAPKPSTGLRWPMGPCYASENWHERGARVDVVVSRVGEAGQAIAGRFVVDLHEAGITEGQLLGPLPADQVPGVAVQASDRAGLAMVDLAPTQVAAVLAAGASLGVHASASAAMAIAEGLDAASAPIEVQTGAPEPPPPPKPEGWFSRLVGKIVGSP